MFDNSKFFFLICLSTHHTEARFREFCITHDKGNGQKKMGVGAQFRHSPLDGSTTQS